METFLIINGFELNAEVDDAESVILRLAAGELERLKFTKWEDVLKYLARYLTGGSSQRTSTK